MVLGRHTIESKHIKQNPLQPIKQEPLNFTIMKTTTFFSIIIAFLLTLPASYSAEVITEQREATDFNGVEVTGVFEVELFLGDSYSLEVKAPAEHLEHIETLVEDNILYINYTRRARNLRDLTVRVTAPDFNYLSASGASSVSSEETLSASAMRLSVSGASNMDVNVATDHLTTNISGASSINLAGEATRHDLSASGVSRVRAYDLETLLTDATSSGTSNVRITVTEKLEARASGTSSVIVRGNPPVANYSTSGTASVRGVNNAERVNAEAPDKDTVVVRVGDREVMFAEGERPSFRRKPYTQWRNNWSGLYLGLNGYFGDNNSINLPPETQFMDLDYNKSLQVNLNMLHQNYVLARGHNSLFGLVSGLGIQWTNYHLSNDVILKHGTEGLLHKPSDYSLSTNRLRVFQLNVPLMMELQLQDANTWNRFHFSAGIQAGFRLRSHTKVEYRDGDGSRQTDREREDFHLVPIRMDAIGQIGWGRLNFFGTYSLNSMFKDDRGPELSPFSIGIRLLGW